jgi:hypothetical protein
MLKFRTKRWTALAVMVAVGSINLFIPLTQVRAADHAESTSVIDDAYADLGDTFAYLNPNDNTKVVLVLTVAGFIVPSEQLNFSYFPEDILYRIEIENTGDAVADQRIDVTFSPQTARNVPQTATITLPTTPAFPRTRRFTAPTTVPAFTPTAPPFVVTTNAATGIRFFAGLTDDPFYFDIVGFGRFVASVLGGTPDATRLNRARDSFAGYNVHMIALEVPAALLRGSAGDVIGVNGITMRQRNVIRNSDGSRTRSGEFVQVDRTAVPAINTALIPFPRKNEYNAATPVEDAAGVFAGSIVGTLTALGTNPTNIGVLASVGVPDLLRLNLATPNTSLGFGERVTTPGYTGFPNGRRPGDDTIDVLLYFISNQGLLMGDNVNSNDVAIPNSFPFLPPPNQPLENPAVDNTRN